MTIDLPREVEAQLEVSAQAEGISVARYVEKLVAEKNVRKTQLESFKSSIAVRIASLEAGEGDDGEVVMDRLINELSPQ